jgi:hypothetical protein
MGKGALNANPHEYWNVGIVGIKNGERALLVQERFA